MNLPFVMYTGRNQKKVCDHGTGCLASDCGECVNCVDQRKLVGLGKGSNVVRDESARGYRQTYKNLTVLQLSYHVNYFLYSSHWSEIPMGCKMFASRFDIYS